MITPKQHATISEVVGESEENDRDGLHFLLAIALSLLIHSTLLMASILNPPKMPVDLIEEQAMVAAALVIKEPPKEEAKVETNAEEIKVVTSGKGGGGGGGKSIAVAGAARFLFPWITGAGWLTGEGNLTDWANSGGNIDSMVGNFGGIALSGESTSGRGIGQGAGFGGGGLSDLLAGGGVTDTGMPSTSELSRSARVRAEMPGVSGVGSASGNRDPKAIYRVVSSYDSAFKARYVFTENQPQAWGQGSRQLHHCTGWQCHALKCHLQHHRQSNAGQRYLQHHPPHELWLHRPRRCYGAVSIYL